MNKLEKIRESLADYIASEGCSCCRDEEWHSRAEKILGELLKVEMYSDNSGYNWTLYESKNRLRLE